jgi:succinate dehydrogenase flavin-adding protein (antitoxin of CptAB toxin-antitoxin module)
MRELDELLLRYLESHYGQADDVQKRAFERFLELSDPELVGYLLQHQTPGPEIAVVVQRILRDVEA